MCAVLDVAAHEADGPVPMSAICMRTGLGLSTLEWTFRRLCRAGILCAVRGSQGGFLLARDARATTVADVIRAVEEAGARQPGGSDLGTEGNLHTVADALCQDLVANLLAYLHTVSLQDLLHGRTTIRVHLLDAARPRGQKS